MRENDFYNWLINNGLQENTANSRLNNCIRVCRYEGDLDMHYDRDRCQKLLSRLTCTRNKANHHSVPRHSIPMNGNIINGTATLRSAVNRYIDFRDDEHVNRAENMNHTRIHATTENEVLQNKDFSRIVADLITRFPENFTANDVHLLTNLDFCKDNFNCKYPILIEIPTGLHDLQDITHIWGNRRFYDDIYVIHSGHRYLISNDWYHNNENSNRQLFKRWIVSKTPTIAKLYQDF